MNDIDQYLAKLTKPEQQALQRIRKIVIKVVPEVSESISYGMPVMKYKKTYLVGFAAFKNHLSIFPGSEVIEQLQDALRDYKVATGTIQFTIDTPLTEDIIVTIVQARKADIDSKK